MRRILFPLAGLFLVAPVCRADDAADAKAIIEKALSFADASPLPPDSDIWTHTTVEEGEPDEKPRERVLGAKDVKWPLHPTDFKVTWDLEPRSKPDPEAKKGAKS